MLDHSSYPNEAQLNHVKNGKGFIAALDQSGGSTPKALKLYGVDESAYSNDDEMFGLIHQMRTRIVNSNAFSGDKVVGAILFEMTMDRTIGAKPAARTLWEDNGVVPFLKVDKGLMDPLNGVQLMKPIDGLDETLARATEAGIFGTKMRSVISEANKIGIREIVNQQFAIAERIAEHGLVPIIEPEISISMDDKAAAEEMLLNSLLVRLDNWSSNVPVMLKLTLPEKAGQYQACVDHSKVLRVVALSGGYDRDEANERLAQNNGVIASFSRALTEGLSAKQSDEMFDSVLSGSISSIYEASVA